VDTSAAVAKYTPSSSLQPGSLRLDSGQTISTTRLTKLGYFSEVNHRGRYRVRSKQQTGLVFTQLLMRVCGHNRGTQCATGITKVNHGYHSKLYRGNIRESTKFLRMHVVGTNKLACDSIRYSTSCNMTYLGPLLVQRQAQAIGPLRTTCDQNNNFFKIIAVFHNHDLASRSRHPHHFQFLSAIVSSLFPLGFSLGPCPTPRQWSTLTSITPTMVPSLLVETSHTPPLLMLPLFAASTSSSHHHVTLFLPTVCHLASPIERLGHCRPLSLA